MKRGFLKTAKVKVKGFTGSELEEPVPVKPPAVMKLSYGKVDTARPTEGYTLDKLVGSEMDGNTVDYSEKMIIFTTLPLTSLGDTLENEPDNWTECILAGRIKRQILSTPGFPRAVLKPPGGKVTYRIRASPFGGLGMFATRRLRTGDFILAERPLLISPRTIRGGGGLKADGLTKEQIAQVQIHEWEKFLDIALKRMTDENRKAFMELANSHTEDGSGPIFGICRTNAYRVKGIYDDLGQDLGSYTGVCKELSRINHSCSPNVNIHFDIPSLSFELRAVRGIKQGGELFYSYCETLQTRSERSEDLAPYGFVCACPGCTGATEKKDLLRKELIERVGKIQADHNSWEKNRLLPNVLTASLELTSELEQEGLTATTSFLYLLAILVKIYSLLGDGPNANRYVDQMIKLHRASDGDQGERRSQENEGE